MAELNPPPSVCLAHKAGIVAACLLERQEEEPVVPFLFKGQFRGEEVAPDANLTIDQAEELALGLKAIVDHARAYAETQIEEV